MIQQGAQLVDLTNKRVLVVPLRFVGDAVVTLPLLQLMKSQYPSMHLSVWCSAIGEEIFGASLTVDECVREPRSVLARFQALQSGQYDAVIILRKSLTMALLCQFAGIPIRCGYDMQRFPAPLGFHRTGWGMTHRVCYPEPDTPHHQAWHHACHLQALTGTVITKLPHPQLIIPPDDQEAAEALLSQQVPRAWHHPCAIIHGLSASTSKHMDLSVFTPVVNALAKQGYTVIATGTNADRVALADWMARDKLPIHNLAGKTTLLQLLAVLSTSKILVGLDSGPVHLAGVSNVPVVALYGPTNPHQWGPLGKQGQPGEGFVPVHYDAHESIDLIGERLLSAVQTHPVIASQVFSP